MLEFRLSSVIEYRPPARAANLIEKGLGDFVAIGRSQLVDPDWANKAQQNVTPIPCLECEPCTRFSPEGVCPQVKKRNVTD